MNGPGVIPNIVLRNAFKNNNTFNAIHLNSRSMFHSMDVLKSFIFKVKIDALLVSETWINSSISDQMVRIAGYKLYRHDRSKVDSLGNAVTGGGVALYLKCGIPVKVLCKSDAKDDIEYMLVEVKTNKKSILLGVVYFPDPAAYKLVPLIKALETFAPNYEHILLGGDFNIDLLDNSLYLKQVFLNNLSNLSLSVVNTVIPTRYSKTRNSLLDLFLTTSEYDIEHSFGQVSIPGVSDHDLIYISINLNYKQNKHKIVYRDFKNINFNLLRFDASQLPWSNMFFMSSIDEKISHLNSLTTSLFEKHVHIKSFTPEEDFIPYFDNNICTQMQERDAAFAVWKRTKSDDDMATFKRLRNKVNLQIVKAKKELYNNILSSSASSKKLWNSLNKLGIGKENNNFEDIQFSANDLNHKFHIVPDDSVSYDFSSTSNSNPDRLFSFKNISLEDVLLSINRVKSDSTGPDNISPRFLKLILADIAPFILHTFNFILTTGTFPSQWKLAKIIPTPKVSNPSINDFRPISILPFLSKAFESILFNQITSFVDSHNMLNRFQSGFRKKHSTSSMLLEVVDNIYIELDKKHAVLMLFLDFSKAFDCVNHRILLHKLAKYFSFHSTAISLINSYLTNRKQYVVVNNINSDLLTVHCGVPQGSLLGPLLFSLFINDLPLCLSDASCRLYADDAQLYISGPMSQLNPLIAKLNDDLDGVLFWAKRNCLKLNEKKTQAMIVCSRKIDYSSISRIKMNNFVIPFVNKVKNLGVIFNSAFTWNDHIFYISQKVYCTLRKLWKLSVYLNTWVKRKLVNSLIVPHFLYCDVVFCGMKFGELSTLKTIFNACTRFVGNRRKYDHISDISKLILGFDFENFLNLRYTIYLKKILLKQTPSYLSDKIVLGRSLRNLNITIPRHVTEMRHRSFFIKIPVLWNSLPLSIRREHNLRKYVELCREYFLN